MSPRQQPEQQAPPVQRLRLRYAKTGRARFASHRDFSRAFERALHRAGVPMAYSSGFSPHPRISYANASPTGAATDAEYLEIGLAATCDPARLRDALNATLPDGMRIVDAVPAAGGSLADALTASIWDLDLGERPAEAVRAAVDALLARDRVLVSRLTRAGLREFDARGPLVSLEVLAGGRIRLVVLHGTPLVRPDDVVAALAACCPAFDPGIPSLFHRRAQGTWSDGRLIDPFTGHTVALD